MRNVFNRFGLQFLALNFSVDKRERVIVFLIFIIFLGIFCNFQLVTALTHHLDSAFLMENLASIKENGIPSSALASSLSDAFTTFVMDAEKLCGLELLPKKGAVNILDVHAYFILYPLAMFTWLYPPYVILAIANGISFVSFVFISYWIVRRQSVPVFGAIFFCLLVMAHPAWSHSSLGDFYADRFFMPLGLLYAFLLHDTITQQGKVHGKYILMILSVGLLAASTTERAVIMVIFFTIAVLVLYKNIVDHKTKNILIIFCAALLAYLFMYLKFLYVGHPASANLRDFLQGLPYFFENLRSWEYASKVLEFIVINVLLFGIFSLFEWRLAIIACGALLPNLLMTIGGAEKNGWGTHYHSMYFPFLVFASAIGYSKLWVCLRSSRCRLILVGLLLILMVAISKYSPGYGGQSGALKRLFDFFVNGSQSSEKLVAGQLQQLSSVVPIGSKVTVPEIFVPTLYRDRTIYFYPVGIDVADYAVLTRVFQPDGSQYYAGAVSYIAGESSKIDVCLTKRLRRAGYNVDHPLLLLGNMAVFERKK